MKIDHTEYLPSIEDDLDEDKPFFGDILEFTLTNDRLPTDAEIAQMPKQYFAHRADQNIIGEEASAYCKEIKPQFAAQNQHKQEHQQEQTQSRGRGM